jgi:hypothetical protein
MQDFSALIGQVDKEWESFLTRLGKDVTIEEDRRNVLLQSLTQQLRIPGILAGAERVVVILSLVDYQKIRKSTKLTDGFAPTTKVIFIRSQTALGYKTAAHELVHTLPKHLFSTKLMKAKCERDYHWTRDAIAHGFQIVSGGKEQRQPKLAVVPLMGSFSPSTPNWISRCTYWHLLEDGLPNRKDPEVLLVSGRIGRNETKSIGELSPSYQLDSIPDLDPGEDGEWAIVLLGEGSELLGRYPFEPEWEVETQDSESNDSPLVRDVLSFGYQVPALKGAAQIDLVGPGGRLDTLEYSATAPTLSIAEPITGAGPVAVGGKVHVAWDGKDIDGDRLLYSTFYSSDRGETWQFLTFEQTTSEADIPVDQEAQLHMVKVIATNGAQSTEGVVEFSISKFLAGAPTPTPAPTPTITPTPQPTPTPMPTATAVPTPTPTPTLVPTAIPTPTSSPTSTHIPTPTPIPTPIPAPSPEPTQSVNPNLTPVTEPTAVTAPTATATSATLPVTTSATVHTVAPSPTPAATPAPANTPPPPGPGGGCSPSAAHVGGLEVSLAPLLLLLGWMAARKRKGTD